MFNNVEFIAEQFQEYADLDPVTAFEDEGCVHFDGTPCFYTRYEEVFVLEIEGITVEVPRN